MWGQTASGKIVKTQGGWYDRICVAKGEKILSHIDQAAIEILRKYQLVWSSPNRSEDSEPIIEIDISLEEMKKLRRFFFSVLWRFAVSDRPEANNVAVDQEELEIIRIYLLNDALEPPYEFFPITLVKLSMGERHNHTPVFLDEDCSIDGKISKVRAWRLFMDGLVVHLNCFDPEKHKNLGEQCIHLPNNSSKLMVIHLIYEASRQFEQFESAKCQFN